MAEVKHGITAALEQLGAAGTIEGAEGQEELFADVVDAPSSLTPAKVGPKGGRPKGARNRSTEEWRQFFLGRYQSPLIGLGETWSRSAEDLARELHLTRIVSVLAPGQVAIETRKNGEGVVTGYLVWDTLEAFHVQQAARIAALPYLHQKQPLAIQGVGNTRGLLVLGDLNVAVGADQGLALPLAPIEENQRVIDVEPVQSDAPQSDAKPNPLRHNDD